MVGTLTNQNPARGAHKACMARKAHKVCMARKAHKAHKVHMARKVHKVVGKKSGFYVNEVVQFH